MHGAGGAITGGSSFTSLKLLTMGRASASMAAQCQHTLLILTHQTVKDNMQHPYQAWWIVDD